MEVVELFEESGYREGRGRRDFVDMFEAFGGEGHFRR